MAPNRSLLCLHVHCNQLDSVPHYSYARSDIVVVADGLQKLQFSPNGEDIKAVVLQFEASRQFDVVESLFLGGTSTMPRGSGGFATVAQCQIPEFPLAAFISQRSEHCSCDLVKQLLRCGVPPNGPPGDPPKAAWDIGRDDLVALLLKNGASMDHWYEMRSDNMLHGAVKSAFASGEILDFILY